MQNVRPILDPVSEMSSSFETSVANESGAPEVYVTDTATFSRRSQVSTDGGTDPVWAHDGRELYFVRGSTMMAAMVTASVEKGALFGRPAALFDGVETGPTYSSYSVAPDGRFLLRFSPPRHDGPSNHVTLVLNWLGDLRRLAPVE